MAPRPKPTNLLKLRGSYNATKHGKRRKHEPIAEGELDEPPPDLTDSQEAEWRYAVAHMPRNVVKLIDRNIFRAWVEVSDRHNTARMMQAALDRDSQLKLLIKSPMGLIASPYNDILNKTALIMVKLAQELGFSPASRPLIHAPGSAPDRPDEDDPRVNPWASLKLIDGGKASSA